VGKIQIDIKTGSLSKPELAVGIDLGTTNSLVAWVDPTLRQTEVFPIARGANLYPSLIRIDRNGFIHTGPEAQPEQTNETENTIYSVKRLIGISSSDYVRTRNLLPYLMQSKFEEGVIKIQDASGNWHSPGELSAYLLRAIKDKASEWKDAVINKAVITVPAYFDETQRMITKKAGEQAGLQVLRIINEPTAACLAYGYGEAGAALRNVVVYDLGGGTFDVSILRVENGVFEVLSTNGNTQLGGDDIDRAIINYWQEKYPALFKEVDGTSLRILAKKAKEQLTIQTFFEQTLDSFECQLDRKVLEDLSSPWIDQTIECCERALADAGLQVSDVDDVLLVGGSTRMPYIKKSVSDFFGKEVNDRINPDEVVAIGAALQAAQLNGLEMGHLLLDVTPLSLGIETAGGLMDVLIPRNSKIPLSASRQYTTQKDGQTSIRISVFQGERELIIDNRELVTFKISGIPAMPAGLPKLNIRFSIDADGLLKVTAHEQRSGIQQEVVVNPVNNLSNDDVEQQLESAILHAQEDKIARARITAIEEAQAMLTSIQKLIQQNRSWIDVGDVNAMQECARQIEQAIDAGRIDELKRLLNQLEIIARPVTEEVMNKAVGDRLRNTHI
jgi:molecular chaperone HscA